MIQNHSAAFSFLKPLFHNHSFWDRFKFKDGQQLETVLTCVEPLKIFVQKAKLPLATVIMIHIIDNVAGKTRVTIQTEVKGILAFFYYLFIGRSIRKKVPIEVQEMLEKAGI